MIKLFGRAKRLDQAFGLIEDLTVKHGLKPNLFAYTCLIQACFQNNQLKRALALHDKIVGEGCILDAKAYAALAHGCIRVGVPNKAADVVRCAFGLPGSSLLYVASGSKPPGMESKCIEEVLKSLHATGSSDNIRLAQQLAKDVDGARCSGTPK